MRKRQKKSKLKIAHLASEVFPFSKTGGLAHAVADMAKAIDKLGHDVSIFTPLYGRIRKKFRKVTLVARDVPVKIDSTTTLTFSVLRGEMRHNGNGKITVYFINHYNFFGRYSRNYYSHPETHLHFYFFCLAVLHSIKLLKLRFDLLQCHDWMTAMTPWLLKYRNLLPQKLLPKTLLTIHNLAFQGSSYLNDHRFQANDPAKNMERLPLFNKIKDWDKVNFLKRGIITADQINTVSSGYASEIATKDYGEGLSRTLKKRAPIAGIINGIDHKYFDPSTSDLVYKHYNLTTWQQGKKFNKREFFRQLNIPLTKINWPLVVMTQRITYQKGFDLIADLLPELTSRKLIFVVAGEGIGEYVQKLKQFKPERRFQFHFFNNIDEQLEQEMIAAADMILVPSRYEPCGTSHLKAMRFGVVPVARSTGGLSDTIFDYNQTNKSGTGFLFTKMDPQELLKAVDRALEIYQLPQFWVFLVRRVMTQVFTWDLPALEYEHLYKSIV